MTSILDLETQSQKAPEPATRTIAVESVERPAEQPVEHAAEPEEFEIVVGRRQIASLLFVSTIILMTCVAGAYMAGKAMSPRTVAAAPAAAPVREPDPPPIVLTQEPEPSIDEKPLFADPKAGLVYIQMGAVEKGVSVVFAEGLRRRGLNAFVAPGPNEKIFRVLIGPLPDPAAYTRAKSIVDQIGLSTFARKYPN